MSFTPRRRAGFTLLELVVAIAVIALLIALLLPAVMQAREASRRSQCTNNLSQIGLALHSYESAFNSFPIGTRGGLYWTQTGVKDGTNWRTSILPYLDQAPVFNKLDFSASFGAGSTVGGAFVGLDGQPSSNKVLSGLVLPVYLCPSSELDIFPTDYVDHDGIAHKQFAAPGGNGGFNNIGRAMGIHYVGIQGAARILDWMIPINPNGSDGRDFDCGQGYSCLQGMLTANDSIRVKECTDGTSNTIIVAEQSGLSGIANGGRGSNRTSNYYGGWAGARHLRVPGPSCTVSSDFWQTGTTCLRWTPNSRIEHAGTGHPYRNNTPMNSSHRGGVHILLTDRSHRFLSDHIDVQLLKKLCIRDDRQVVGGEF